MSLLTCLLCIYLTVFGQSSALNASDIMDKEKIIPEVIDKAPKEVAEVSFSSGGKVHMGDILTPTQGKFFRYFKASFLSFGSLVKDPPTVKWTAENGTFYTICMTDPDAPNRVNPKFREWHHWLVGNIPGNDISKGTCI